MRFPTDSSEDSGLVLPIASKRCRNISTALVIVLPHRKVEWVPMSYTSCANLASYSGVRLLDQDDLSIISVTVSCEVELVMDTGEGI